LLDAIVKYIPEAPSPEGPLQMQITSLDYSSYVGRIAIGRVTRGSITDGMNVALVKKDGSINRLKIKELFSFSGLGRSKASAVYAGDICALVGLEGFEIGDTITDPENPEALPDIHIDEPTMSMLFTINNSPFFGREGKYVTSRHLNERLRKETEKNLALRVEETSSSDQFIVYGRGILHLSILIETMRREGYELQVGQPQVIIKEIKGVKCEPVETLIVDTPAEVSGKVIELVTQRKGELLVMAPKGDLMHLEFTIPSRGIIGLRNAVLTATAGEAIMAHRFTTFEPLKGALPERLAGVLVSIETGTATAYSIDKLADRGRFFVEPFEEIYEGQIVGENTRDNDLGVNIVKAKQMTNFRTTAKDDAIRMPPAIKFSLEEALEYIQLDEMVEITPKSMRLRKIHLREIDRKRLAK
jgi:GTP-binding protein